MTSYNGSNESYEYRVTDQIFIKCQFCFNARIHSLHLQFILGIAQKPILLNSSSIEFLLLLKYWLTFMVYRKQQVSQAAGIVSTQYCKQLVLGVVSIVSSWYCEQLVSQAVCIASSWYCEQFVSQAASSASCLYRKKFYRKPFGLQAVGITSSLKKVRCFLITDSCLMNKAAEE